KRKIAAYTLTRFDEFSVDAPQQPKGGIGYTTLSDKTRHRRGACCLSIGEAGPSIPCALSRSRNLQLKEQTRPQGEVGVTLKMQMSSVLFFFCFIPVFAMP